jgi:hypothetical protein
MANQEFESKLKGLMGDRNLRPFVCEGSPMDCKVFIVGSNPATEMSQSFWSFWSSETGFNKKAWFEAYKKERALKPLEPDKTRRNSLSNTRQRIEWIVEAAHPIKCLETNLYGKATEEAKALSKSEQDSSIFEFLIQEVRPTVMLLHGKASCQYVKDRYAKELIDCHQIKPGMYNVTEVSINYRQTTVITAASLAYGWSQDNTRKLGEKLREICI